MTMKSFGARTAVVTAVALLSVVAFATKAGAAELTPLDCRTVNVCSFASGSYAGARWETVDVGSTGSGVINPFVRVQGDGIVDGHNTDGTLSNNELAGTWTHAIQLSSIPLINVGGNLYYEFLLDINQNNGQNNEWLALNNVQICLAKPGDPVPAGQTLSTLTMADGCPSGPASYTMGAQSGTTSSEYVILNANLNSGSGSGDLFMYIPMGTLGTNGSDWVYLYSQFGGRGYPDNDGFEEWAVRICGEAYGKKNKSDPGTVLVCATPTINPNNPVPEPGSLLLLGTGLIGLAVAARRLRG